MKIWLSIFAIISLISCKEQENLSVETGSYSDGTLKYEYHVKNGKRNGWGYEYYESGKLKAKSFWKEDIINGQMEFYYYFDDGFLKERRICDSLGRSYDYFIYNKDGSRDFSPGTKDPEFIATVDTVLVGEIYEAKIRLGNRQFSHVDVILGDVNDKDIVQKNKPLPKLDSLTSILRIQTKVVGKDSISGVVFERNQTWDSMDVIPFTHRYYVKPN